MTDKKDKKASPSPVPQTRSDALLQTIIRINTQHFPRISDPSNPKILASTSRENDSPNSSIRLRKGYTNSMQLSRSDSPHNLPVNISRDPTPLLSLPLNQIKKVKKPPSKSVRKMEDDDGLRRRSNTLEDIGTKPESPVIVKKILKRLQTDRKIEVKTISPRQKALKSFRDNSPQILAELKDPKKLRSEKSLRGYSIGGMEDITKRVPVKLINIREKRGSQPNTDSQHTLPLQSQLSSLIQESKFDFSKDRKKLKKIMVLHRKDMDQISKKHFKPSFKLRWAVNVLGKPPDIDYRNMYSCSKPGFGFFKKKFMNIDQEI